MTDNFLFEIFDELPRQGPGGLNSTEKAYKLIEPYFNNPMILDVGSGTGAQTFDLMKISGGNIIVLEKHLPFLKEMRSRAIEMEMRNLIAAVNGDMFYLPFKESMFDIIWSEGAIYLMGFENGLKSWRTFLKPGGFIAVSEVAWLTINPPEKLFEFWSREYPSITSIENNIKFINNSGFELLHHFVLPSNAWWDDFYAPLEKRLCKLRAKYVNNIDAEEMIEATQHEINLFKNYTEHYGYVFYIMKKN